MSRRAIVLTGIVVVTLVMAWLFGHALWNILAEMHGRPAH